MSARVVEETVFFVQCERCGEIPSLSGNPYWLYEEQADVAAREHKCPDTQE